MGLGSVLRGVRNNLGPQVNHNFRSTGGRRGGPNGTLDVACLMQRVEDISDSGKAIFKAGESQISVNLTFTLLSVDGLSNDGVGHPCKSTPICLINFLPIHYISHGLYITTWLQSFLSSLCSLSVFFCVKKSGILHIPIAK